jgi:mannosyltransferase OCH1-like enzyme
MIPKTIIQTSIIRPPKYVVEKIMAKSEGWTYLHFDDDAVITFFQENYLEEFKDVVSKFHSMFRGEYKADLFRYYYLYIYGGVYMDTDAMVERNLDDIVKDYTFISVNSTYFQNTIFQGFIGVTPRNDIIYKALQDIYKITQEELRYFGHILCRNLYNIIQNDVTNESQNIHLLKEKYYTEDAAAVYDDDNVMTLIHYWNKKIIPL